MNLFEIVKNKSRKGFTLIELMVVISIISLLSSIVFSSLNSARAKARDANRISDIKQIQNALELYYSDHGYYPQRPWANTDTVSADCDGYTEWCGVTNSLKSDLAPYYNLPTKNSSGFVKKFYYKSLSGNNYQTYGLAISLENNTGLSSNDGGFYSSWYEVGPNPSYCKSKYDDNWWNATSSVCIGGN